MTQEPITPGAETVRVGMSAELAGITEAVNSLIAHMDQSLPEDRMQALANAVVAEERSGRRRLTATIVGALAIIIFLAASSLLQSTSNGRTLNEAKAVSSYVRNCIQHPERLTAAQKADQCGGSGANSFFITYLNCAFTVPLAERTEARLNSCVQKAVVASQATPTTTTR